MVFLSLKDVETTNDFSPMPVGEYVLRVEQAEVRDTKSGTGKYIRATMTVVGGKYEGRKVWHNFNIVNKTPEAVMIGKQELKRMLVASGIPEDKTDIQNLGDIVGITFGATIDIDGEYNRINRFRSLTESTKQTEKTDSKSNPFWPN